MATVYNDEWIVPHIPKCGGTSIGERLPRCGLGFVRVGITQKIHSSHLRLQDVKQKLGIDPLDRKVLAVIRSPWDREVSHYSHLRQLHAKGNRTVRARRTAEQTFDEFVCDPKTSAPYIYASHCYPECCPNDWQQWLEQGWDDYLFWLTIDGRQHPNITVVLLENIERELSAIFNQQIPVERLNTSRPEQVEWTPRAVESLRHKYWWGIQHYDTVAMVS